MLKIVEVVKFWSSQVHWIVGNSIKCSKTFCILRILANVDPAAIIYYI